MNRLNIKGSVFATARILAAIAVICGTVAGAEKTDLRAESHAAYRIETRIEVSGELRLLVTLGTEDGGKSREKTTKVPVEVTGKQQYVDRVLPSEGTALRRSVRLYDFARADMHVGTGEIASSLSDDRQRIILEEGKENFDLFSPAGPLDRAELELLAIPCDAGLLNHLLPAQEIKVGDSWELDSTVLARLLRIDVVNKSDVQLTLSRIEKGVAMCDLTGTVSGAVEGVASDLEIVGKLNFDTKKKCCTWLAADLTEERAPSQGTPGFRTKSRFRVAVAPCDIPAELTDQALAELKTTPDEATRLLRLAGKPGFELIYEPDWRVVTDQPDLAVLRLIDRGDLVAQCNISRLKPLGPGEQLTLEAFRDGLKTSLGNSFTEYVEAGESLSDSGLRMLRVVISAKVSEVPIHYVFYHLSDDHQNRLTLAFTMDAEQAERFGRSEETLVNSLQFTTPPPEKTTPADQAKKPSNKRK